MLNFGNKEFRNLQEQVLKNAQDIEVLKEKPSLKIVIVEELPATGEEGILYLVPKNPDPDTGDADSYDEYVWLSESETYELVGTTAIDLQNLPSPVYITTSEKPEGLSYGLRIRNNGWTSDIQQEGGANVQLGGSKIAINTNLVPGSDNQKDLGETSYQWHDVHIAGSIRNGGYTSLQLAPYGFRTYNVWALGGDAQIGNASVPFKNIHVKEIDFEGDYTPQIKIDSSNRIGLYHNNVERIKIGNENSTYCTANWTPDQDSTYNLGAETMRWAAVNAGRVQNKYSSFFIEANGDINVKCSNSGGLVPSSNNLFTLGKSGQKWLTTYTRYLNDDSVNIAVSDIVTKPNYANPDVFESGTLDANGEGVIDMTETGMPSDGLYMFTYGNAQCFISLTSTMIQNATLSPIRCPCPLLYNGTGYPGNLRIDRSADILTLKVAAPNVGVVQPSGFQWQLIKVM